MGIKTNSKTLQTELEVLVVELVALATKTNNLASKSEHQEVELEELKNKSKSQQSELEELEDVLKTKIDDISTKCQHDDFERRLKNVEKSYPFKSIFSAYYDSPQDIISGKYITFDAFHVNIGDNFDLSSGEYVAPTDGIYEFSFSGEGLGGGTNCNIEVWINDSRDKHEFATLSSNDSNIASTWIFKLNNGDKVRLYVEEGTLHTDTNSHRIFSGQLLQVTTSIFSAYIDSDGDINTGNYVSFDAYHVNIGANFNLSTGEYVAPMDGIYEFSFSGEGLGGATNCNMEVRINDAEDKHEFATLSATDSNLASTWMFELNKGDKLRLYVEEGSLHTDTNSHRIFNGKLLPDTSSIFSAYIDSTSDIKSGKYVSFDAFHVNKGDDFDLSTGEYVAPTNGIYEFSFSGEGLGGNTNCNIEVRINGAENKHEFATLSPNDSNLASTWMFKLNSGDKVRLYVEEGTLHTDTNSHRIFSGKLLQAIEFQTWDL